MNLKHFDIIILGGGPAAAATALGMLRLGYSVGLVTQPRPFAALEGISQRVIEGLKGAGLEASLEGLPPESPRQVSWNGQTNAANVETLVDRSCFDRAMVNHLQSTGVAVFQGRAEALTETVEGWTVSSNGVDNARLCGRFLVEARGRSAPATGIKRFKGPETLSLLHYWHGPVCQPFSAVESFEDGWAWMAVGANGCRYLQLTLDSKNTQIPAKRDLPGFCVSKILGLEQAARFIENATPTDQVHARTSASVLHEQVVGERWIRIGDAAMAVDPLSGNGIFQALSSALVAPAVINTLLVDPQAAAMAKNFYQQRTQQLFYRFARIGRDFYQMESRWQDRDFWCRRAVWPDRQQAHPDPQPGCWKIEPRPVVDRDLIRVADVLVTPEQPLGIWRLLDIELAPVMRVLAAQPLNPSQPLKDLSVRLETSLGLDRQQAVRVCGWLHTQGLLS